MNWLHRLFNGDVFTNTVGSAPLTIDDAWEAARLAGLDQDLKNMPMGMRTVVSEGGGGLSGDQRQPLMIARAIVNKPLFCSWEMRKTVPEPSHESSLDLACSVRPF